MVIKPKIKKPKWQQVLDKAELTHLKKIGVLTKKAFVINNDCHNTWRNQAGAVEPCYTCKGIALKMALPVTKLKPEDNPKLADNPVVEVKFTTPREALKLVDDNKPVKPELPLIYWIIAISTIMTGIASAITYWKGWWQ